MLSEIHFTIWPGFEVPDFDRSEVRRRDRGGHARYPLSLFAALLVWSVHGNRRSFQEALACAKFMKSFIETVAPKEITVFTIQPFME